MKIREEPAETVPDRSFHTDQSPGGRTSTGGARQPSVNPVFCWMPRRYPNQCHGPTACLRFDARIGVGIGLASGGVYLRFWIQPSPPVSAGQIDSG